MNSRIKTKKGAAKRFKITSSGKLLKRGGYSSHLKKKKNEWIVTINSALKKHDLNYNRFMELLKKNKIYLNRKVLAEIIKKDSLTFDKLITSLK